LEILIAMAILVMVLSAVVLVAFGSQSMLVDSQTNSEAISKAQEMLEHAQALARKDFKLVNPTSAIADDIYQKKVDVAASSDPLDFFTKKVTATISWPAEHGRTLNVKLDALVTNFENASGGDTCNSVLGGDWAHPNLNSFFVSDMNINSTVAVDVYSRKLYVAISNANSSTTPTVFIYSLADPSNPSLADSFDNADGIKTGVSDLRATDKYLYLAKATGPGSGQLQIFDNSVSPPVQVGSDFKVTGATGGGGQATGNTIFYKDGYVYLGLTATASGPEFHIIDVHDPANPFEVGYWPSSGHLGHDINAIYVKGRYVYLAHPIDSAAANIEEVTVLDISNPTLPQRVGGYDAPDNAGHGKSLYLVGDTLYLGRTQTASNPEFYILDSSNPASISATSSQEISSSVNDLIVRDYLAFLITTDSQFQIWRLDNPSGITQYAAPLALPNSGEGSALDCEGNYFYVGSLDSANNAYISVISAP